PFTLGQRFAHQAQLTMFQVPQAAMDQLGAGGGGVSGQIVLLDEAHRQSAARRIARDARAIDAAPDDQQIVRVGNCREIGAGLSPCHGLPPRTVTVRTSCCDTGMVMLFSLKARQMARFTSERTLFTPCCGSVIQKRSSSSMPESPKFIRRDTGRGSASTRGLQKATPSSTCSASSGSSL